MSHKNTHQVSMYDTVVLCMSHGDYAQSVEKEHLEYCCRTLGVDVGSLTTEAQDMIRLLLMCDDVGLMPPWPDNTPMYKVYTMDDFWGGYDTEGEVR